MIENKEPVRAQKLTLDRFKGAEYERLVYRVVPKDGTPLEALREPMYWSHVAAQLRPTAIIEVIPDDMSYFAELLVISCGNNWATVEILRHVPFATAQSVIAEASAYEVKWKGPHHKFAVIRKADNEAVQTGFARAEDGAQWLAEHKTALQA